MNNSEMPNHQIEMPFIQEELSDFSKDIHNRKFNFFVLNNTIAISSPINAKNYLKAHYHQLVGGHDIFSDFFSGLTSPTQHNTIM